MGLYFEKANNPIKRWSERSSLVEQQVKIQYYQYSCSGHYCGVGLIPENFHVPWLPIKKKKKKKRSEDLKRHFSKDKRKKKKKCKKRCSTSIIIREMQIKTMMRYHLTGAIIGFIKKSTHKCW